VSDTLAQEPVVMIGAGGVGLMALGLHKKMGGKAAIVVDIDPAKREAALKAGASRVIDGTAKDVVDQVRAATGGGAGVITLSAGSTELGVDTIKEARL
jgi:propanol-preferring alcohol dehydrogenase